MTGSPPPKYGLRLAAVRVENFRALRDLYMTLSNKTTVLVGENNSGKTSLLQALGVALGHRRSRLEDLFDGPSGRADQFQIDLRIEPTTGDDFADPVRDIVTHAVQLDDINYVALRVSGQVSAEGWDIRIKRRFLKGWGTDAASASTVEVLDSPLVSRDALGLLHYDMLDARRDIVEQLRNRRTYWGRTTSSVSIADKVRSDLEQALAKLSDEVTNKSNVLTQVKDDLSALSSALSQGSLNVELEALPRSIDDLIRSMDIVLTSPGSSTFPVGNQGMGTRSLAALLVFRSYVNVVRPKQHADRLLSLAAFEEPEAHLHPQSQRSVFTLLSEIGGQRIVSTHSTHVASIAEVDSYRVFRREGAKSIVSEVPPSIRSAWSPEHVRRYVQLQNPEMLFAKAVGVVEGQTESAAFPVFSRQRWGPRGSDGVGVSLIYTEGAGNSKHIVPFLEALGIPWVLFCDGDSAADKGLKATAKLLGKTLDRNSPEVVQLPKDEAFEDYIMSSGLGAIVRVAADKHNAGPLDDFKTRLDGQPAKKGKTRDYSSPGHEERACIDFMKLAKGTFGGLLATCIVDGEATGKCTMPGLFKEFFDRLDTARGVTP